jgi:hypothetical protein
MSDVDSSSLFHLDPDFLSASVCLCDPGKEVVEDGLTIVPHQHTKV